MWGLGTDGLQAVSHRQCALCSWNSRVGGVEGRIWGKRRRGRNGRGSLSLDIGCVMPIGKLRRFCVVVFGPCLGPSRALP